ncbi:hypothetical protein CTEN210_10152 [Chaetoceros tenuissimus]|uniref:Protein kinase domain-containing protein n=1 Tax=Chaetoceros tenuissimus TaxID=426638 RepID=A0AAD3CYU8_9STRA|nr:hypothetical protein CTEN210_10152 [Chaetoceros tenuissimus]
MSESNHFNEEQYAPALTGLPLGEGGYNTVYELLDCVEPEEHSQISIIDEERFVQQSEEGTTTTFSSSTSSSSRSLVHDKPKRKASLDFVVKKIREDLSLSRHERALSDLKHEANLLKCFSHQNIIALRNYETNEVGPRDASLVIERVSIDLKEQIPIWKSDEVKIGVNKLLDSTSQKEKRKQLQMKKMKIAYEISDSLYSHIDSSVSVIYRDLKPENIGLTEDDHVKMFDFGLAKLVVDKSYRCTQCVGTPKYMSPEVYYGTEYGFKADIYSFALVFWEILSSEFCFENFETQVALAYNVYEKGVRPKLNWTWSRKKKALIQSSWEKDPSKRPSAKKLRDELQQILKC